MPKLVDHAQRREELAGALWRLVMREGIEAASLRRVAAEAGWSMGALRHYFETQSDLLAFAMELVVDRVSERVSTLDPEAPRAADRRGTAASGPPARPRALCRDAGLARLHHARTRRPASARAARRRTRSSCAGCAANAVDLLGADDPEREAERLHALVDGLALHAVHAPGVTTPERQVELLAVHLDSL